MYDDPRIRAIGRKYALEAHDLADELHTLGADASQLLRPWQDQDLNRPRHVMIPSMFADVLMAILVTMPRPQERKGGLGENVVALRPRRQR
jgi:hypothetical protein